MGYLIVNGRQCVLPLGELVCPNHEFFGKNHWMSTLQRWIRSGRRLRGLSLIAGAVSMPWAYAGVRRSLARLACLPCLPAGRAGRQAGVPGRWACRGDLRRSWLFEQARSPSSPCSRSCGLVYVRWPDCCWTVQRTFVSQAVCLRARQRRRTKLADMERPSSIRSFHFRSVILSVLSGETWEQAASTMDHSDIRGLARVASDQSHHEHVPSRARHSCTVSPAARPPVT